MLCLSFLSFVDFGTKLDIWCGWPAADRPCFTWQDPSAIRKRIILICTTPHSRLLRACSSPLQQIIADTWTHVQKCKQCTNMITSSKSHRASKPPVGIEPTTVRLRSACSANWAIEAYDSLQILVQLTPSTNVCIWSSFLKIILLIVATIAPMTYS